MARFRLELGVAPWLGASDAIPDDVFDRYDNPLAGVLIQDGQKFVFECASSIRWANIWVYAPVSDEDLAHLMKLKDDEFDDFLLKVLRVPECRTAYADGDRIIGVENDG